jgi:signal transduction histidine kinase
LDRIRSAQVVAVTVTLVALTTAAIGTSGLWHGITVPCEAGICLPFERPTRPTLDLLTTLRLSVGAYATVIVVISWALLLLALGVSLVLVWRRPSMLTAVTGIQLGGVFVGPFADVLAQWGGAAAVLRGVLIAAIQLTMPLLVGLFPDGRWHPRWFRWGWVVVGVVGAGIAVSVQTGVLGLDSAPQGLFDLLSTVLLAGLQIHRYVRVSDWTARQQAKWFILSFVLLGVNVLVANILSVAGVVEHWQLGLVITAYLAFVVLILGFAFALLRYRLYDVTFVLRRAVVYGGAVVLLLVTYVGLVALASLSMARASASAVGAAVVAALALTGGLVLVRAGGWFRDRLLGPGGRPGGVAAVLAHGMAGGDSNPANLAETIAAVLVLPAVTVLDSNDQPLWTHGELGSDDAHRESVVDGSGAALGALLVVPADGTRLSRQERRGLREVLPFVVLVLRAQREADELLAARTVSATAREDERRRLRRDLHDVVGPLLAGQLLTVDSLRLATERGIRPEDLLTHLEDQARAAITEVRRVSRDLRPAGLDTGLATALEVEVQRFRGAGLDVQLHHELPASLPAAVEVAVLRIVAEALTNVVRHAGVQSAAAEVIAGAEVIEVSVVDAGRGFGEVITEGVGLVSMRERAEALGGRLEIDSDGTGTRVYGRIPL